MFKIAIQNPKFYLKIINISIFKKFFVLKLTSINELEGKDFIDCVSKVLVPGKVWMTTQKNRFAEIDDITINLLKNNSENYIHDVAVSVGITTLDLFDKLERNNIDYKLFVSEKYSDFLATGKYICKVYSADNEFIEGYFLGLVAQNNPSWALFLSKLLFKVMYFLKDGSYRKRITIFDKRLQDLIKTEEITIIKYDVLSSIIKEKFSYIRCMNLLNLCYFNDEQLYLAVTLLMESLKENGILQIGRTEIVTGTNHVSFFKKENNKLRIVKEVNGGTEIMKIIKKLCIEHS